MLSVAILRLHLVVIDLSLGGRDKPGFDTWVPQASSVLSSETHTTPLVVECIQGKWSPFLAPILFWMISAGQEITAMIESTR